MLDPVEGEGGDGRGSGLEEAEVGEVEEGEGDLGVLEEGDEGACCVEAVGEEEEGEEVEEGLGEVGG